MSRFEARAAQDARPLRPRRPPASAREWPGCAAPILTHRLWVSDNSPLSDGR